MRTSGFNASKSKKVIGISVIIALVLAAISMISAFAAPTSPNSGAKAFGAQLRDLDSLRLWYNNAKADKANFVRTSSPNEAQQYLNQYAFALTQAEAVVSGHGTVGDLSKWLHEMRGLRDKLSNIGFSGSGSGVSVAGGSVPVTGGTSNNSSATPSSSSSSSNSATSTPMPTATSGTSSSSSSSSATSTATPTPTDTPTATPTTSG